MVASKQLGGIKGAVASKRAAPVAAKTVGGVKAGAPSRFTRDCEECKGETVIDGDSKRRWIHSRGCPYTVAIWFHQGKDYADWDCPFGCEGNELVGCITHNHTCEFWESKYGKDKTPF